MVKETPLKDMLKKRSEIYTKLGGVATMNWNDLYSIDAVMDNTENKIPQGTILVFKSARSKNICGVGIFSLDGKMRMTPLYFSDKYYDAAKEKDIIEVYLYNEKTNTISECACSFYNRHTDTQFNILTMPKWYTNIELDCISDIGSEDIKF